MTEQPRDWDKELAAIDRVIARSPANPPGAPPAESPRRAVPATGRMGALGTWVRVLLGAALAVGITQWPYPTACGTNLMMYGMAIMLVIVAGAWSALSSWRRQLGLAHLISLAVLLWGLVLAAREVLPRIGYARDSRSWICATSLEAR